MSWPCISEWIGPVWCGGVVVLCLVPWPLGKEMQKFKKNPCCLSDSFQMTGSDMKWLMEKGKLLGFASTEVISELARQAPLSGACSGWRCFFIVLLSCQWCCQHISEVSVIACLKIKMESWTGSVLNVKQTKEIYSPFPMDFVQSTKSCDSLQFAKKKTMCASKLLNYNIWEQHTNWLLGDPFSLSLSAASSPMSSMLSWVPAQQLPSDWPNAITWWEMVGNVKKSGVHKFSNHVSANCAEVGKKNREWKCP